MGCVNTFHDVFIVVFMTWCLRDSMMKMLTVTFYGWRNSLIWRPRIYQTSGGLSIEIIKMARDFSPAIVGFYTLTLGTRFVPQLHLKGSGPFCASLYSFIRSIPLQSSPADSSTTNNVPTVSLHVGHDSTNHEPNMRYPFDGLFVRPLGNGSPLLVSERFLRDPSIMMGWRPHVTENRLVVEFFSSQQISLDMSSPLW